MISTTKVVYIVKNQVALRHCTTGVHRASKRDTECTFGMVQGQLAIEGLEWVGAGIQNDCPPQKLHKYWIIEWPSDITALLLNRVYYWEVSAPVGKGGVRVGWNRYPKKPKVLFFFPLLFSLSFEFDFLRSMLLGKHNIFSCKNHSFN